MNLTMLHSISKHARLDLNMEEQALTLKTHLDILEIFHALNASLPDNLTYRP